MTANFERHSAFFVFREEHLQITDVKFSVSYEQFTGLLESVIVKKRVSLKKMGEDACSVAQYFTDNEQINKIKSAIFPSVLFSLFAKYLCFCIILCHALNT